jgi:enoyl-CoA hydratase/carnithine racemase
VVYYKENTIARITLNRPEALNAFSLPMINSWASALQDAQDDPDIRVIVVSGTGRAFCTGGDVKTLQSGNGFIACDNSGQCWGEKAIDRKGALTNHIHKVALTLDGMDKPVICAINGLAVGAGLDMAMMCDIRIASTDAKMTSNYVKNGVVPGDGGCFYLPRLVGLSKALELLLTGDFITAQEALNLGLVNKIVPPEELEEAAMEMAQKIAGSPPVSVQMIKRAVYSGWRTRDVRTALDLISSHMAIVIEMDDHKEALDAISEKRRPKFTGR